MDDLQHRHSFLQECPCVFALQETDNWNVAGMEDSDKTAMLCTWQNCQVHTMRDVLQY